MSYIVSSKGPRSFTYSAPSAASRYTRFFSVTITHNYYTQEKGLCPDFRVAATPATRRLMSSLGLVLKDDGTGFSVYYTPDSLPKICTYLRREAHVPGGDDSGFWSRLTFLLELVNPEFVGITALPIAVKTSKWNLYGCNRQAHKDSETVLLPPKRYLDGQSLYRTVGSDVTLEKLPVRTSKVFVTDISGTTLISGTTKPEKGAQVQIFGARDKPKTALIDLSTLPNDLYTINVVDHAGRPVGKPYPQTVLYVPPGDSMVLLDMLFTQPERGSPGVYPITPLHGGKPPNPKQCGNVTYHLPFDARSTYWQYYVASEVTGAKLTDLSIRGKGAKFKQGKAVTLPNGSKADLFVSDSPLPLRQKSPQSFQLSGVRRDPNGQENAVALARLPVAPGAPVWPAEHEPVSGTSEIYVYV